MTQLSIATAFLVLLTLTGCSVSPEDKVKQAEATKEKLMETSGYNACMKGIADRNAAEEACWKDRLVAEGYADGISCVGSGEYGKNPVCNNVTRYNAEVNAMNDCSALFHTGKELNTFDCLDLMTK